MSNMSFLVCFCLHPYYNTDLEWLQTPEKEPTPPPPEPPTQPPTPVSSPVPIPEIKMDPYDRRMRKAKGKIFKCYYCIVCFILFPLSSASMHELFSTQSLS